MLDLIARGLYHEVPPESRTSQQNHPTLLFSWWCTAMAFVVIFVRIVGRLVRTNKLFREDKIMAYALIPLFIRMIFAHFVLQLGTNNENSIGITAHEAMERSIGSRLVLASRIFYALFIWMAKFSISEFLKRLTVNFWKRSYEVVLRGIRVFLALAFCAVFLATLAECHPFPHYWQVIPDPEPKCRLGFAQLITMGVADIITDILLIFFPIPIILVSSMQLKRKISLIFLFSLSAILILITACRVPAVINRKGRQQYRTMWASAEILAAASVSNALVVGSFVRDKGVKRNKWKVGSVSDAGEKPVLRRATPTNHHLGSDEELIRSLGYRLKSDAERDEMKRSLPRPAPMALPAPVNQRCPYGDDHDQHQCWNYYHPGNEYDNESIEGTIRALSNDSVPEPQSSSPPRNHHINHLSSSGANASRRRHQSFFDLSGLVESGLGRAAGPLASSSGVPECSCSRKASRTKLVDIGGLLQPLSSPSNDERPVLSPKSSPPKSPSSKTKERRPSRTASDISTSIATLSAAGDRPGPAIGNGSSKERARTPD